MCDDEVAALVVDNGVFSSFLRTNYQFIAFNS